MRTNTRYKEIYIAIKQDIEAVFIQLIKSYPVVFLQKNIRSAN